MSTNLIFPKYEPKYIYTQGKRLHAENGKIRESVTGILSGSKTQNEIERLQTWKEKQIKEGKDPGLPKERGKQVHSAIEKIRQGDKPQVDPWVEKYLDPIKPYFKDKKLGESLLNEGAVWCDSHEGHPYSYAGSIDDILRFKSGDIYITDYKTGDNMETKLKYSLDAHLQIAAYAKCMLHTYDFYCDKGLIIFLVPNEKPYFRFFNPWKYYEQWLERCYIFYKENKIFEPDEPNLIRQERTLHI